MAEIDFPTNPADGETYTHDPGGVNIVFTYSTNAGWSRSAYLTTGNDPNVFAGVTSDSMSLGENPTLMQGIGNTILGKNTGTMLGAGKGNTFTGAESGSFIDQSDYNTVLGYQAGKVITGLAANKNTIIGARAQSSIGNAVNTVVIGADATIQATGNTNSIVIGTEAIGAGSNTVVLGNQLIATTVLRGAVQTGSYTIATLPSAAIPGQIIWISDEVSGGTHSSSNGTNWVIIGTQTVVTATIL